MIFHFFRSKVATTTKRNPDYGTTEKNSLSRQLPVAAEVDIAVAGGSCTGVFAAVTAARRGAKCAIVEAQNRFGGTATAGQVCYWHSLFSTDYSTQIIAGLTQEVIDRMKKRNLVEFWQKPNPDWYVKFNTEELCCELDEMIVESGVMPFLHTRVADVLVSGEDVEGIVIAGKDGLSVIRAKYFIDATGDADVVRFAGRGVWRNPELQTSTSCVKFSRWPMEIMEENRIGRMIHAAGEKYKMPEGALWGTTCCGSNTYMFAGTNIPRLDSSRQKDLTEIEIESRRQMRAVADIVEEAGYPRPVIEAVPSLAGIRESCHIRSLCRITVDELLSGKVFDDAAGKGTYRSDVHRRNPPGTLFRYLDGTEILFTPCEPVRQRRWRDASLPTPQYYTWPLRSQIPVGFNNLITAGRMIDADAGAYGALRVMVNMNQSGEAAGDAAFRALEAGKNIPDLVRRK